MQPTTIDLTNETPTQNTPQPSGPPPPYNHLEAIDDESEWESDISDADVLGANSPPTPAVPPVKLTINAARNIRGCNNIISTSATPLADAAKVSAWLTHVIKNLQPATAATMPGSRGVPVDLTINCGITVIGNRNVVAPVGVSSKSAFSVLPGAPVGTRVPGNGNVATVAGAKRKAEDVSHSNHAHHHCVVPMLTFPCQHVVAGEPQTKRIL